MTNSVEAEHITFDNNRDTNIVHTTRAQMTGFWCGIQPEPPTSATFENESLIQSGRPSGDSVFVVKNSVTRINSDKALSQTSGR